VHARHTSFCLLRKTQNQVTTCNFLSIWCCKDLCASWCAPAKICVGWRSTQYSLAIVVNLRQGVRYGRSPAVGSDILIPSGDRQARIADDPRTPTSSPKGLLYDRCISRMCASGWPYLLAWMTVRLIAMRLVRLCFHILVLVVVQLCLFINHIRHYPSSRSTRPYERP